MAAQKNPAFVACLTALLRWPDVQQPLHLLQGYPIVGSVQPCGVSEDLAGGQSQPELLVGQLCASGFGQAPHLTAPAFARDILDVTEAEMAKGFCGPLRSKCDLDQEFDKGNWKFLERFLVVQPDGKKRVIDNGRKSGHNAHTQMHETISTVTVDFIGTVARMLLERMPFTDQDLSDQHPWCALRLGTDDLPDAYRVCQYVTTTCATPTLQFLYHRLDGDLPPCMALPTGWNLLWSPSIASHSLAWPSRDAAS